MTPEGKVKEAVKKLLKRMNIWFFMPVAGPYAAHGIPDIIACRPVVVTPEMVGTTMGQFIGVETKAPGKISNTTINQDRVLQEIKDHGGLSIVVDDVRELAKFLTKEK
jgi:hypothetical protein